MVRGCAIGFVALVLVALAGRPVTANYSERLLWRHGQGHFENTRGNTWVEKSPGGVTYYFVERRRYEAFVELYDGSRDCTVRLWPHRCMVRFGPGPFEQYYTCYWER